MIKYWEKESSDPGMVSEGQMGKLQERCDNVVI